MKNRIYYTFFFVLLIVAFIVGVLYKFGFPYWLYLSGFLIIIAYLKDVFTGFGWFQGPMPPPVSHPGMTAAAYEEIVAGYPDLSEIEKNGYEELSRLCVERVNLETVLSFIRSLKDYSNDVDDRSTLNVFIEFLEENNLHFIMGLDGRSAIEDLEWYVEGALKQNFDQEIKLPEISSYPKNASVAYDNVFIDYDIALRKHGFQLGFINEGSDSYLIIVHKTNDKYDIIQSVSKMGYPYYDCTDDANGTQTNQVSIAPSKSSLPESKFPVISLITLLLCPFFSYAIYKGYLKEGISTSVVLIGISNLGFYFASIYNILWRVKKK